MTPRSATFWRAPGNETFESLAGSGLSKLLEKVDHRRSFSQFDVMKTCDKSIEEHLCLYHAPASYYSMIARLALAEAGVLCQAITLDIHLRMSQQQPAYARLNANMTVPTLVTSTSILTQSQDIALFAFGVGKKDLDSHTSDWLDVLYSYSVEELTFSNLLVRNPLARALVPVRLEAVRRRLLGLAVAHPDLSSAYAARAALFAGRRRILDPGEAQSLFQRRRGEAISLIDRLEADLSDRRSVITPPHYGVADVVWTVFLARLIFVGLGAEIRKRPAVNRYWLTAYVRPSFKAADIWTHLRFDKLIMGILSVQTTPQDAGETRLCQ